MFVKDNIGKVKQLELCMDSREMLEALFNYLRAGMEFPTHIQQISLNSKKPLFARALEFEQQLIKKEMLQIEGMLKKAKEEVSEDAMCAAIPDFDKRRIGSRRARLRQISVRTRKGCASWVQKLERPPIVMDCRKLQRKRRRKK